MDSNFVKLTVRAQYKFKASNNDELTFKKGDLITVTQKEDGGWWEGTSHETGKTGWFPSNYVKEVEPTSGNKVETAEDILAKQIDYRQQVIRDLIEKEREFVAEIEGLQSCYLEPLKRSEILSESEYQQLIGNTDELLEVHRCMHVALQDASAISGNPRDQRIGRVMLNHGSNVRASHLNYWANHPKAVCILEKYREELDLFMETHGASKPGLMVLTTSLSRPLRHLEKYAGTAQELEQHLEDDHPDRGDTQRSVSFYKNVASDCAKLRRQKELELEVLTGVIREWEGEEKISQLGEILHMGSVAVGPEHKDRYFVLFPATLVILSVSSRMSAFIYEGKLPLSGIAANRLEDIDTVKNSFEITGPMIDRIVVVCQSKQDSLKWVDILRNQIKTCRQGQAVSQQLPQPPQQLPFHHTPTPAHVSSTSSPPYSELTFWIRQALASGNLTIENLRHILKSDFPTSPASHFVKRQRLHKVECVIFPSQEFSDRKCSVDPKRELVLDYEAAQPYSFIRYFDPSHENAGNLDDDEITFLLPHQSRSSGSSSSSTTSYISSYEIENCVSDTETVCGDDEQMSHISTENSMPGLHYISSSDESDYEVGGAWGCKILPKNNEFLGQGRPQAMCRRFLSTECDNSSNAKKIENLERRSMPCIYQITSSDETSHNVEEDSLASESGHHDVCRPGSTLISVRKSSSMTSCSSSSTASSDIRWIDRTPSESSLQLPFCPPMRLDYEDFPKFIPVQTFQETKTNPKRYRRSREPPERELTIIPLNSSTVFPDFQRTIPSSAYPLLSSKSSFISSISSKTIYRASKITSHGIPSPPEEAGTSGPKSHFVEVIIQISPPPEFASPAISPPPSFSSTLTRPNFPNRATVISRNSASLKCQNPNSIRSSMRDSGLADVSPNVGRRKHPSSTTSLVQSTSPTSGLSSDGTRESLGGLPTTPPFLVPPEKRTPCQRCLPLNLFNRKKHLVRQRSQSLDDSSMYYTVHSNFENDGAISCMDLPVSSLSTDIYEDDEQLDDKSSNYHNDLYANWWPQTPLKRV